MRKKWFVSILALLLVVVVAGCAGGARKKVVVASKPHTEQYILAEMLAQLIEKHSDIKVERKFGIGGGTANIHPAMVKGDVDIYPEYTGTGWLYVLKREPLSDAQAVYRQVGEEYRRQFKIKWLGLYGFNNTYALAVPRALAEKWQLETFSDLARHSDAFTFGAEYDFFEREDGYNGLVKAYGFRFKGRKDMDIGLKYEAVKSGQVNVINAFSTDGQLQQYQMKVLRDDRNYFPTYYAATLVREETLQKYPELEGVLNRLSGKISDQEMTDLNYQVEIDKKEPAAVATQYLQRKGLL